MVGGCRSPKGDVAAAVFLQEVRSMWEAYYQRIGAYFSLHPHASWILIRVSKSVPVAMGTVYLIMLGWLLLHRDIRLWETAGVPALAFFIGTILRKWLNWPRPYEHMDIQPVVVKQKQGLSFPSRHSISAFAIAWACWKVWPMLGWWMFAAAVLVAMTRVLLLVHHVRDVVAGAVLSLAIGYLFDVLCRVFA